MYQPKEELYKTLKDLGYYCRQGAQATFADGEVPAITFRIENNSVDLLLDNTIGHQDIIATVDIWADDSKTASRVLTEVEKALREIGWRMSYSADVPAPTGALFHINCRFETLHTAGKDD